MKFFLNAFVARIVTKFVVNKGKVFEQGEVFRAKGRFLYVYVDEIE